MVFQKEMEKKKQHGKMLQTFFTHEPHYTSLQLVKILCIFVKYISLRISYFGCVTV